MNIYTGQLMLIIFVWNLLKSMPCSLKFNTLLMKPLSDLSLLLSSFPIYLMHLLLSFPKQHHYECYKKLAPRSWPALFTLTNFLLIHTLSSAGKWKVVVISLFLSKLYHRPLFNNIYYETILRTGFNTINKHHTLPII